MKSKVRIKVAGGVFRAFFTRIQAPPRCLFMANLGVLPGHSYCIYSDNP